MALSPNYGWSEPDNSSLVKNGAADIRTLGDAIDTSLWNVGFGQAGKNKIINGDFGIWQRGTSFTSAGYCADRFQWNGGTSNTLTRQTFTPGTAPVAGYESQYFARYTLTTAGDFYLAQYIEDVRTFAGQTVTVSFWTKTSTASTIQAVYLIQSFGSGGSGDVVTTAGTGTATTTGWTRVSYTATLPSISGKTIGANSFLNLRMDISESLTGTWDIWGVQLEYGSKATPFQTATGTIQGELAACQRYYYRSTTTNTYGRLTGYTPAASTTGVYLTVQPPVKPRVSITAVDYSNIALYDGTNVVATISSISLGDASNDVNTVNVVCTGLTQFRPYALLANNNVNGYIGFSAEL